MSKIIAAVLSISIVICLAGCGSDITIDKEKNTEQTTVITQPAAKDCVTQTTAEATTVTNKTETTTTQKTQAAPETTKKTTTTAPSKTTTTTSKTTTIASETTTAPAIMPDNCDTSSKLYYFPYTTNLRDMEKNKVGTLEAGSFYSGHYDPNYEGYVVINYRYREYLIARSCVEEQTGAKILETAAIGQMGGDIYGKKACGPTSATMLVNYQLGMNWTKDELITFCEQNKLNDQGSLESGGGITAPNLVKLINSYSGETITARNVYGDDSTSILKWLIDNGQRSIVVTSYRSYKIVTQPDSPAHFVVICGYEYIDGELYFYYADPYFGNGGKSLMKVSAKTLATSMNYVTNEPRCIITVTNNA